MGDITEFGDIVAGAFADPYQAGNGEYLPLVAHTYLGSDSHDQIALANRISGRQPTRFAAWARANFPA